MSTIKKKKKQLATTELLLCTQICYTIISAYKYF